MAAIEQKRRRVSGQTVLLAALAVMLGTWFLQASYYVSMPLVASFFLAALVRPVHEVVARWLPGSYRWVGVVAAMAVLVLGLAVLMGLLGLCIWLVVDRAPQFTDELSAAWNDLAAWIEGVGLDLDRSILDSARTRAQLTDLGVAVARSTWQILGLLGLMFFLTLMMLLEWDDWRGTKGEDDSGGESGHGSDSAVRELLDEVSHKLRQYLFVRTVVSLISAVVSGLWLWIMGVELWLLWATLVFLLNFIPNVGSVISTILPSLMALLTMGSAEAALVAGGLVAQEAVIGQFVDPRLASRALSISPVLVLMSVVYWGWVWSVAGALLAVPMTVTLVLIVQRQRQLRTVMTPDAEDTESREESSS